MALESPVLTQPPTLGGNMGLSSLVLADECLFSLGFFVGALEGVHCIYLFMQQIVIEHQSCAKHCFRALRVRSGKKQMEILDLAGLPERAVSEIVPSAYSPPLQTT